MKHCLNIQLVGDSKEELQQQFNIILNSIKTHNDSEGFTNQMWYIHRNMNVKDILEWKLWLQLGEYYKIVKISDEFHSLSPTEMYEQLEDYLSKSDSLYLKIKKTLEQINKHGDDN
jgi:hypothetical protein